MIYDKNGNEITHMKRVDATSRGKATAKQFKNIMNESFKSEFELCYVKSYYDDNWIYNIGIQKAK